MGAEVLKDEEGKEHYIFDQSELYDDKKMGDKLEDFEILQIHTDESIKSVQSILNQKIYSMKTINFNKKSIGPKAKEKLEEDIKNYIDLNYFYILKFYKYFKNENEIHIIAEHTNNGSFKDFIKLHSSSTEYKDYIKEEILLNIFLQSIQALKFLHSKKIIHKSITPKHLLMTNEKVIKLELCPVKDTSNKYVIKYEPPEEKFSEKSDIYSLGCIFYQICFLVNDFEKGKFDKIEEADTEYSKELKNIIKSMVEEDPNKRPTSEELFDKIREQYDKKITKNSSISSIISCLYSINRLTSEFIQNKSRFENKEATPISSAFFDCLNNIENKNKWLESIKTFRRNLGTKNPKLDGDREVDPFFLLIFLVENMHKELNIKPKVGFDMNQGYLIKRKEDKTNKADMVINFFRYFKEHFNSIMSETFFGIMKNKNICKGCGLKTYSFNCFCFLYFDIDKLVPFGEKKTLKLQDFFNGLKDGKFYSNFKNEYFCKGCSELTVHELEKKIYYMPNSLIICFLSKEKCQVEIDYPDFVNLSEEREYSLSPSIFNLQGFINRIEENGEERYVSYFKSPINGDMFSCKDTIKEESGWNKNKGKVVMLFYEGV